MKRSHLYVQCACIQFNQDDDGIITNDTGMFFVDFNCTGCNPYRPYSIKTRNHSASVTNLNAKWNHFAMAFFSRSTDFFSLFSLWSENFNFNEVFGAHWIFWKYSHKQLKCILWNRYLHKMNYSYLLTLPVALESQSITLYELYTVLLYIT